MKHTETVTTSVSIIFIFFFLLRFSVFPGDSWRKRYKSLCLHDPVWYDHMPYLPFPDDWPVCEKKRVFCFLYFLLLSYISCYLYFLLFICLLLNLCVLYKNNIYHTDLPISFIYFAFSRYLHPKTSWLIGWKHMSRLVVCTF